MESFSVPLLASVSSFVAFSRNERSAPSPRPFGRRDTSSGATTLRKYLLKYGSFKTIPVSYPFLDRPIPSSSFQPIPLNIARP